MHRNPGIDTLRGLSVVLVVLFHIKIRFPIRSSALADIVPVRLLDALTVNGFSAVTIFFVISGFLITRHTLRRHGTLGALDLRAFYVRRAARILPFLLLLLTVLSLLHGLRVPLFTIDLERQSLMGAVLSALFLHLNVYEARTGYLPGAWDVLWSLSIEEVFYIGFPLVCVLLRRRWLLTVVFLGFALSLPATRMGLSGIWMSKAYLPGMASISMGVVAGMASPALGPRPPLRRGLRWLGAVGVAFSLGWSDWLWAWTGHGTVLCLTVSAAVLMMGLDRDEQRAPWPGLGWLRSFGRLSYEVYLTHMFIVLAAEGLLSGLDMRHAHWVYLPVLALSWVPGFVISRYFTNPVDQALRARWLPKPQ